MASAMSTPINDLHPHNQSQACWCGPTNDDGVWVHHSLDGRERLENAMKIVLQALDKRTSDNAVYKALRKWADEVAPGIPGIDGYLWNTPENCAYASLGIMCSLNGDVLHIYAQGVCIESDDMLTPLQMLEEIVMEWKPSYRVFIRVSPDVVVWTDFMNNKVYKFGYFRASVVM